METSCVVLALFVCFLEAAGYKTHTVERNCPTGNLTLELSDSGPDSALLIRTTERTSYSVAGKCKIKLRVPTPHHRIVAAIREIGFRTKYDGTCEDFIRIERAMCSGLLHTEEEHHFYSSGDTLDIFHSISEQGADNSTPIGFPGAKLTVTALTPGHNCSVSEEWFQCGNGFCIWSELRCDSHNNCGDRSDEHDCGSESGSQSTALIILAILILLLLMIMCTITLLCSKKEAVRRFSNRLRTRTVSYMTRSSK